MKNVFLLPTNKKSRIHLAYNAHSNYDPHNKSLNVDRPKLVLYNTPKGSGKNIFAKNLYITNTERGYKYGDYVFYTIDNSVIKVTELTAGLFTWLKGDPDDFKKIVMTNDQDLIADGVQEVSSSFLDFYVANPTDCVEVTNDYLAWRNSEGDKPLKEFYCVKNLEKMLISKTQEDPTEKMYSEEEIFEIIDKVFHMYASSYRQDAKEWFTQFKK